MRTLQRLVIAAFALAIVLSIWARAADRVLASIDHFVR